MPIRIGIDVGGTKCLGVAVERPADPEPLDVRAELQVPTPHARNALVDALLGLVVELEAQVGEGAESVGIGLPGLVDRAGVVHAAPNLPAAVGLDATRALAGRGPGADRRVTVDNDANCAVWGEHRAGAGVGHDDVLMVTLGTGIGGGIVSGGRLQRGRAGFAAEVGHMVVDRRGPPCPCGRRGCWERFASGSGLARLAREAVAAGRGDRMLELAGGNPEGMRGEHVARAAAEGDVGARAVLAELARWLGLGLANLAAILDPGVIVVGGGLVELGEDLLGPARATFDTMLLSGPARPLIPVVAAALGARAGAVGAALLGGEG